MKPKTIFIIIIVVLVTILTMQNFRPVGVRILFWQPDVPVIVLVLLCLIAGFAAGYIVRGLSKKTKKDADAERG